MTARPVRDALFAAVLFSCQGPAAVLAEETMRVGANPIGPHSTAVTPIARIAHPAVALRADSAL